MKFLAFSIIFLNMTVGLPLYAGEVTPATVAERLAKDEGYQLFSFRSESAQLYRLVTRFNGAESPQNTLDIPACKECVVAVRLGKHNALEMVRVYTDDASTSMGFPAGHFPDFNVVASQSLIRADDPFLTLRGTGGELQLILRPRKA